MAYTPTVWKNGEFPPIDAEHLNKIEQGIANSAPGGFGLGGAAKMLTEADNVDNIRESGWYTWDWDPSKQPAGLPEEAKYHTGNMRVDGTTGGNYTTQTIYFAKNGSSVNAGDECVIQRLRTIAPWEWVNPPMILGTEYRTTERYLGKPVYTMAFSFGALPNASDKDVAMPGTDGTCKIIEIHGYASNEMTLPGVSGVSESLQVTLTGIGNKAYIKTGTDRSNATATIVAKYTKTTD